MAEPPLSLEERVVVLETKYRELVKLSAKLVQAQRAIHQAVRQLTALVEELGNGR